MRFRLRSILLVIAGVAMLLAVGMHLYRKAIERQVLLSVVENRYGVPLHESFDRRGLPLPLISDRLIDFLEEGDASMESESNAMTFLRHASSETPREQREVLYQRLARMAAAGNIAPTADLGATLAYLVPKNLFNAERQKYITHLLSTGTDRDSLDLQLQMGGRRTHERLKQLLEQTKDDAQREQIAKAFSSYVWPDLVEAFQSLAEREALSVANLTTQKSVVSDVAARKLLLTIALNNRLCCSDRQLAIGKLSESVAGRQDLTDALVTYERSGDEPDANTEEVKWLQNAVSSSIAQARGELMSLATELHAGTARGYWYPATARDPVTERLIAADRQRLWELCRQVEVRARSANELDHAHDTQEGLEGELQFAITQVLVTPEAADLSMIVNRLMPWRLGYVPDACQELYRDMLESESPRVKLLASEALFTFTASTEPVPVLIELIRQSDTEENRHVAFRASQLLRRRFGSNQWNDASAWERWWKRYQVGEGER